MASGDERTKKEKNKVAFKQFMSKSKKACNQIWLVEFESQSISIYIANLKAEIKKNN